MQMNCPKCDADISESYQPDEPDVGIAGGWFCNACDLAIGEHEINREPLPDDVEIEPRGRHAAVGTPLSALSSQPGDPNNLSDPRHAGYAEWCRIARSWGYD